jgi:hypothetical protein
MGAKEYDAAVETRIAYAGHGDEQLPIEIWACISGHIHHQSVLV